MNHTNGEGHAVAAARPSGETALGSKATESVGPGASWPQPAAPCQVRPTPGFRGDVKSGGAS